jgi:hypothetical protein
MRKDRINKRRSDKMAAIALEKISFHDKITFLVSICKKRGKAYLLIIVK